jgi:hypothetical protein
MPRHALMLLVLRRASSFSSAVFAIRDASAEALSASLYISPAGCRRADAAYFTASFTPALRRLPSPPACRRRPPSSPVSSFSYLPFHAFAFHAPPRYIISLHTTAGEDVMCVMPVIIFRHASYRYYRRRRHCHFSPSFFVFA